MKRPSPIGAVTVITAIMVLCMTVFAVLTYSSGQAELRLAQAGADAVTQYYSADRQAAQLVAAAIDGRTEEELQASADSEVYFDGDILTANIPAGIRQTLHIQVEMVYNSATGRYSADIIEWRTVSDTEVEGVDIFG